METFHGKLVTKASKAVNAVFSDCAVSQEETLDSLKLLRDELNILIGAIEADLEAAQK